MKRFLFVTAAILLAVPAFGASVSKPTSVELTIYNQNFALVKEWREMTLEQGVNFVPVQDVASRIETSSVAFKSVTDPASVIVREQNYQYDVIDTGTILNKSVGKKIKFRRYVGDRVIETEGVILEPNGRVIQTPNGILMNISGEMEITELPEGLVSRPTLVWKLETTKPGNHVTEISYLTNEIKWIADYVAVVDPLDKYIDLTGWVTLDNKSGATYENAKLNLMAGDVHRVQERAEYLKSDMAFVAPRAAVLEPQFTEKSFFEYHLYTMTGKTTVRDRESKQVTLLAANRVPAKKVYVYDGARNDQKVNVFMEVVNSKENNLGMPLPKGKVKVYKQETDANQHFVGEDMIDHTPKDEKVRLLLGNAFDLVGERKMTNQRRISDREQEFSYEISLRNHKDSPATIVVVERAGGEWRILKSSHKYEKKDAQTFEYSVEVPKDGEEKITYTIRSKW